jgi:GINS complex subunit 1
MDNDNIGGYDHMPNSKVSTLCEIPNINIQGDEAVQLVKDIRRATLDTFPMYQEELVQHLLRNTHKISQAAQQIIQSNDISDGSPHIPTLMIFRLTIMRWRRCLLAYHYHRLYLLLQYCKSPTNMEQYHLNNIGLHKNPNLTHTEKEFLQRYTDIRAEYQEHFSDLRLFQSIRIPPRDIFVQVRVLHDCGTVQTEHGAITLKPHTMHYLRLSDIEHLIIQGLVTIVE